MRSSSSLFAKHQQHLLGVVHEFQVKNTTGKATDRPCEPLLPDAMVLKHVAM